MDVLKAEIEALRKENEELKSLIREHRIALACYDRGDGTCSYPDCEAQNVWTTPNERSDTKGFVCISCDNIVCGEHAHWIDKINISTCDKWDCYDCSTSDTEMYRCSYCHQHERPYTFNCAVCGVSLGNSNCVTIKCQWYWKDEKWRRIYLTCGDKSHTYVHKYHSVKEIKTRLKHFRGSQCATCADV